MVQGTHGQGRGGQRPATLLLGIEGLAVASVGLEDDGARVVEVVTLSSAKLVRNPDTVDGVQSGREVVG